MKAQIEQERFDYATKVFDELHIAYSVNNVKRIDILMDDDTVVYFFPYTGWFSGKRVVDGRGIKNLLKQLKDE